MKNKTVAFQGEYGAFSEQAAVNYFGKNSKFIPNENFRDVFEIVKKEKWILELFQLKILFSEV